MASSPRGARLAQRRKTRRLISLLVAVVLIELASGILWVATENDEAGTTQATPRSTLGRGVDPSPEPSPSSDPPKRSRERPKPINQGIAGITTFRGNATRTYYGRGPAPSDPVVLWRFPVTGAMCSESDGGDGLREWCGTGWTGQPNVVEVGDRTEVRFGAYDRAIHVLDAETGAELYAPFVTGDLIKGTVTSDPDGYPLIYSGSRDNYYRALALDRGSALGELWRLDAASAPLPMWNNDWDGSGLIIDDYLLEGGENSWFYVVKLNRGYDEAGLVTVDPEIRAMIPGFDDQLLADLGDGEVSIENSVAFRDGVAYFANSGGLVQGWDVARVLDGGKRFKQVFRYWVGEDVDASIVIDPKGFLYVAAELERYNARGIAVGQLIKLDPTRPDDPLVWSISIPGRPDDKVDGGIWSTPALHRGALYATTNTGRLLAVDRRTGVIDWESELTEPAWSSPVVVNRTLIVGDCAGTLHAFDVKDPLAGPPEELWTVDLPGCIESTPAVWKGKIYVGARDGGFYAIGDP